MIRLIRLMCGNLSTHAKNTYPSRPLVWRASRQIFTGRRKRDVRATLREFLIHCRSPVTNEHTTAQIETVQAHLKKFFPSPDFPRDVDDLRDIELGVNLRDVGSLVSQQRLSGIQPQLRATIGSGGVSKLIGSPAFRAGSPGGSLDRLAIRVVRIAATDRRARLPAALRFAVHRSETKHFGGSGQVAQKNRLRSRSDADRPRVAQTARLVLAGSKEPNIARAIQVGGAQAAELGRAASQLQLQPDHIGHDFGELDDGRFHDIVGHRVNDLRFFRFGPAPLQSTDSG